MRFSWQCSQKGQLMRLCAPFGILVLFDPTFFFIRCNSCLYSLHGSLVLSCSPKTLSRRSADAFWFSIRSVLGSLWSATFSRRSADEVCLLYAVLWSGWSKRCSILIRCCAFVWCMAVGRLNSRPVATVEACM
jgi:hypothetical protein